MADNNQIKFAELVDVADLDALMASFNEVIGIANAVIDVDGVVITQSGWQDACTQYHRVNPTTCARCIESDTSLVENLTQGTPFAVYRCLNGLVDTAAPIIVDGQHVANVFTGQFFTDPPDLEFFRKQALEFGFDEAQYLAAIKNVPIVPMKRVEGITRFYANIARMLASHGLDRLRQQESERKLEQLNRELAQRVEERTRELLEKNQLLRAVLDAIPSRVFWKDAQSRYLGCNRRFAEDTGVAAVDAIIGLTDNDLPWSNKAELYWADDREVVQSGQPKLHYEESARMPDGSVSWVSTSKVPLFDAEGKVIGLLGAYEDITERKRAEDVARTSMERLNEAQRIAQVGNWELDLIGGQLYWSAEIFQIFEIDADRFDATYEAFLNAIHPDDRDMVDRAYADSLEAHQSYEITHRLRMPDGRVKWVNERCETLYDEQGKALRSIGTVQDITSRKLVEEALQHSNSDLEQFAYSVSHDMRQPLRMVSGHLQLLARSLSGRLDDDDRTNLNFALDGAKRMDAMIVSLLEYSRVGRKTEAKAWMESRMSLDEALRFLEPAIEEARAEISVDGEWPRIYASRDEMTRLLQNLVGNAVYYHETGKQPRVEVVSTMEAGQWHVCVRDHGIGIDPQQIGRLFQFFSRLQSRTRYDGTGMGLALCRRIVEHHGGRIWAESEGEGQGSRFVFELPLEIRAPKE